MPQNVSFFWFSDDIWAIMYPEAPSGLICCGAGGFTTQKMSSFSGFTTEFWLPRGVFAKVFLKIKFLSQVFSQ